MIFFVEEVGFSTLEPRAALFGGRLRFRFAAVEDVGLSLVGLGLHFLLLLFRALLPSPLASSFGRLFSLLRFLEQCQVVADLAKRDDCALLCDMGESADGIVITGSVKDLLSFGPFHHRLPRVLLEQFFAFLCVFEFIDSLSLSFRLHKSGEGGSMLIEYVVYKCRIPLQTFLIRLAMGFFCFFFDGVTESSPKFKVLNTRSSEGCWSSRCAAAASFVSLGSASTIGRAGRGFLCGRGFLGPLLRPFRN